MKKKYFEGPNGVYYQRETDKIILIEKREIKRHCNIKTLKLSMIPTYTLNGSDGEVKDVAIIRSCNLRFIGEL